MTQPRLRHDFTPAEIDQLEDRLYEHNAAASGHRDGLGLEWQDSVYLALRRP